jgi:hypothetical protein
VLQLKPQAVWARNGESRQKADAWSRHLFERMAVRGFGEIVIDEKEVTGCAKERLEIAALLIFDF